MCCDNPIDLGCKGSCDSITLDLGLSGYHKVTVKYMLNGALIERSETYHFVTGDYVLASGFFNEDFAGSFGVYDQNGDIIQCYKVKIEVCNDYSEAVTDTELSTTGVIGLVSCTGSTLTVDLTVTFSDTDALQDGVVVSFVDPAFTIISGQSYLTYDGTDVTITDVAAMVASVAQFTIRVTYHNPSCAAKEVSEQIASYSTLASGYVIGTNNLIIYNYIP